jgi:hypothetical protein
VPAVQAEQWLKQRDLGERVRAAFAEMPAGRGFVSEFELS